MEVFNKLKNLNGFDNNDSVQEYMYNTFKDDLLLKYNRDKYKFILNKKTKFLIQIFVYYITSNDRYYFIYQIKLEAGFNNGYYVLNRERKLLLDLPNRFNELINHFGIQLFNLENKKRKISSLDVPKSYISYII